jgi:hypothetical protein
MQAFPKAGLDALLTPDHCVVVLIDHQPFQFANVNKHEPTMVINNTIGLAMTAKAYGIRTILATVNEERGGLIFKGIQDGFPDHKTLNRIFINAWQDKRVVEAVKKTSRQKVVSAALWTEMSLRMRPAGCWWRHTIWPSVASSRRAPSRSLGWGWPENFSAIGPVPSTSKTSARFLPSAEAPPVLPSRGKCSCFTPAG